MSTNDFEQEATTAQSTGRDGEGSEDEAQGTGNNGEGSEGELTQSAAPIIEVDGQQARHMAHDAEDLGKGKRSKFPSSRLRGFIKHTIGKNSPSLTNSSTTSPSLGTPFPITHCVDCERFSMKYRKFIAAITRGKELKSFKEAITHEGWRKAMQEEIDALEEQGTWVLEELPPRKKALGSKWVYREKYDEHGNLKRLKARLVIFGNHQVEGLDYNETFAPVAKMSTVRTFLSIAAIKNWEVHQMDVHNAFLHGDLEEEVYMKIPPGFNNKQSGKVCRLKKSLYGLKQAPRCWFAKLATALKTYGFKQSYSDYSLFTLTNEKIQLNVLIYVDDLIVAGNDIVAMKSFKTFLGECFKMKDLGVLKYFL